MAEQENGAPRETAKNASQKTPEPMNFEESLQALTQIVARLEDGQLGLDDSLREYEQGVKYLKQCHGLLTDAERKIEMLKGIDENGDPVVQPFDAGVDDSLEEKAEARGRRRSIKSPKKVAKAAVPDSQKTAPQKRAPKPAAEPAPQETGPREPGLFDDSDF